MKTVRIRTALCALFAAVFIAAIVSGIFVICAPLSAKAESTVTARESINPESLTLDKTVTTVEIGKTAVIGCTLAPSSAVGKVEVNWRSSNNAVAVVKNGKVTGLKEGSVTVTATAAVDATITDSVEITVTAPSDAKHRYTFTDATASENFTAAFVKNESVDGGKVSFDDYWKIEDGLLKRINLADTESSNTDFASLYLNDGVTAYFEASIVYRNSDDKAGWIGFTFGTKSYAKPFSHEGLGTIVQVEGYPTIWGKGTGINENKDVLDYGKTDWHILKVRVYGKTVEMYIDDMISPLLTKNDITLNEGNVGIVTTAAAPFEILGFTFDYLDCDGNVLDYSAVQSIAITNKITTATVGDTHKITVGATPQTEIAQLDITTSDGNVAFVKDGVLRFISEGEVTVTVTCSVDKRLTDSMTVTVKNKSASVEPGNTETPDNKPNEPVGSGGNTDKKGCGSTVGGASCAFIGATLLACFAAVMAKKRKSGLNNEQKNIR